MNSIVSYSQGIISAPSIEYSPVPDCFLTIIPVLLIVMSLNSAGIISLAEVSITPAILFKRITVIPFVNGSTAWNLHGIICLPVELQKPQRFPFLTGNNPSDGQP